MWRPPSVRADSLTSARSEPGRGTNDAPIPSARAVGSSTCAGTCRPRTASSPAAPGGAGRPSGRVATGRGASSSSSPSSSAGPRGRSAGGPSRSRTAGPADAPSAGRAASAGDAASAHTITAASASAMTRAPAARRRTRSVDALRCGVKTRPSRPSFVRAAAGVRAAAEHIVARARAAAKRRARAPRCELPHRRRAGCAEAAGNVRRRVADASSQTLKRTPLHDRHVAAAARLVPFAGWEMPVQYADGIRAEHVAVRNAAGIFDVSHMGQIETTGPQAGALLQRLISNDVDALQVGASQYAVLCREDGGIIDDLLTYRLAPDRYLTVTNAANHERDFAWFAKHAEGFDAEVSDARDRFAMLAIQGPRAREIVQSVADAPLPGRHTVDARTLVG